MIKIISYILITVVLLFFIFPYYWMFVVSIQPETVLRSTKALIPQSISTDNFKSLFKLRYFYRWNFNSMFTAIIASILVCFSSTLSGYAFAKKQFPGRDIIFWCFIITMAIPKQSILLPLFLLMRDLRMINTFQGLIIPPMAWPFGIFLIKQVIKTIPNEIIDAGRIDGASEWQIFYRLIIPMAKPGIIALGLFTFTGVYNDYFWQLLMLSKNRMMTLPLGVATLQDRYAGNITLIVAGAVMASFPVIIVYIILQKYFIKGIRIGALK